MLNFGKLSEIVDMDSINRLNVEDFISQNQLDALNEIYKTILFVYEKRELEGNNNTKKDIRYRTSNHEFHVDFINEDEYAHVSGSCLDKNKKLVVVLKYFLDSKKVVLYFCNRKEMVTLNQTRDHEKNIKTEIFSSNSADKIILMHTSNDNKVRQVRRRGEKFITVKNNRSNEQEK